MFSLRINFLFDRSEDTCAHKKMPCVFEVLEKTALWHSTKLGQGHRTAAAERLKKCKIMRHVRERIMQCGACSKWQEEEHKWENS